MGKKEFVFPKKQHRKCLEPSKEKDVSRDQRIFIVQCFPVDGGYKCNPSPWPFNPYQERMKGKIVHLSIRRIPKVIP